jgi:hypothetical protein
MGVLLAATFGASSARATDVADALAAARTCAAEANRLGVSVHVDCMDQVALADFKQLMLSLVKRFPNDQGAFVKQMFGESSSFDEVAALPPADFMKRVLQRRELAAQKQKIASSLDIIGAVKDGERVLVLVRERSGPLKPSSTVVATTDVHPYIKRDGQWRSELRGDAKQLEQLLRKQLR